MEGLPIPSFIASAIQRLALGGNGEQLELQKKNEKKKKLPPNPLSYPLSSEPYSSNLFKNPTSEYRGMPLWAWNNKLNKDQLLRQVEIFGEMGLGGFHMHSRTGLDIEYLGTEFMDMISACVDAAEEKGLLACLYDEDRWPSGTAGGKVIKDNPAFKKMKMKFTPNFYDGNLLAAYIVEIDGNGCLKSYRILKDVEIDEFRQAGTNIWFAYTETDGPDDWFNGQTYVDTMSKDAMAHFIELTHEQYKAKIGHKFGTTVPCIFTDEPEFTIMNQLDSPNGRNDVFFSWTADFLETYKKEYSADLLQYLPELVWNLPGGKPSAARANYRDYSCERFVSAFMDQLAGWCEKNNLFLNGHMMEEPTLRQQTCAIGEAMRCYRSMQMPGMDLLCDWIEYNTAKQVSSVGRQNGLRGAMSELYGVTHWDFTFEGHKGCGDWHAALGITQRVHHLTWVSMIGEAKRDYPASIGYQSPWYKEYGYVESHFARVGVAMTRGKALTRVAVIHPIESYWLSFGPNNSGDELSIRDQAFSDLTAWLLHALIDFDFISESLLPGQHRTGPKGKLSVGACEYDVIVLPNLKTIRSTTLKILQDFTKSGGKVVIAGSAPSFVDAGIPKHNPVIENSGHVLWSQQSILAALEDYRELQFVKDAGAPNADFLYQMREDGKERFVFVCNRDRNNAVPGTLRFKGDWDVIKLDTLSGEESRLKVIVGKGWTTFPYVFEGCASLLVRLSPSSDDSTGIALPRLVSNSELTIASSVDFRSASLTEANVLVLDYAEYKLNSEEWSPQDEVLRIDNTIRRRFGFFTKGGNIKQPWVFPDDDRKPVARATLRFTIKSDFTVPEECRLALEDADKIMIHVNDVAIPSLSKNDYSSDDWWVDQDIRTVSIPPYVIHKGSNTITLSFDYTVLTNVERVYLLGKFSVALEGHATRLQPLSPLVWGNIVPQGFPFYVGNIVYKCSFTVPPTINSKSKQNVTLSIPNFSSPVLSVTDAKSSKRLGMIAFQPHTLDIGSFKPGTHEIEITAYGNRYNSFGHIHTPTWLGGCGPGMWRTGGDAWTDDYVPRPIGIMNVPEVKIVEVKDEEEEEKEEMDSARKDSVEWVKVSKLDV